MTIWYALSCVAELADQKWAEARRNFGVSSSASYIPDGAAEKPLPFSGESPIQNSPSSFKSLADQEASVSNSVSDGRCHPSGRLPAPHRQHLL